MVKIHNIYAYTCMYKAIVSMLDVINLSSIRLQWFSDYLFSGHPLFHETHDHDQNCITCICYLLIYTGPQYRTINKIMLSSLKPYVTSS